MVKFNDLTGQRFGRLTVISRAENIGKKTAWNCICDCNNEKVVVGNNLRTGHVRSCGCLSNETRAERFTTHGLSKEYKSEYKSWTEMISRCYNVKHTSYKNYGSRGIAVCDKWRKSFEAFISDMGEKPSDEYSIDRIDVNGNYEPSNCKWATDIEQARNKRIQKRNVTGVNGVTIDKETGKYRVQIKANKKAHFIGRFATLEEAVEARKKAEEYYWNKSS